MLEGMLELNTSTSTAAQVPPANVRARERARSAEHSCTLFYFRVRAVLEETEPRDECRNGSRQLRRRPRQGRGRRERSEGRWTGEDRHTVPSVLTTHMQTSGAYCWTPNSNCHLGNTAVGKASIERDTMCASAPRNTPVRTSAGVGGTWRSARDAKPSALPGRRATKGAVIRSPRPTTARSSPYQPPRQHQHRGHGRIRRRIRPRRQPARRRRAWGNSQSRTMSTRSVRHARRRSSRQARAGLRPGGSAGVCSAPWCASQRGCAACGRGRS